MGEPSADTAQLDRTQFDTAQLDAAQLLASGVFLRWPEVLALVQALAAARTDDLAATRLLPDGRLAARWPSRSPTPEQLAKLLQRLLPAPGTPVEPRVPAALRYTLLRALGGITAPPFPSLEAFSASLSRFEQGERTDLLRGVFARWQSSLSHRPSPPPARELSPGVHAVEVPRDEARAARDDAAPADLDPAGQLLLRPDEPRFAAAAPLLRAERLRDQVSPVDEHPPALEALRARRASAKRGGYRRAGGLLTTLAVVSLVLAGGIVGLAVLLSDGTRHSPLVDAIVPRLAEARERVAAVATGLADSIRRTIDSASASKRDGRAAGDPRAVGSASDRARADDTGVKAGTSGTGSADRGTADGRTAAGTTEPEPTGPASSTADPMAPGTGGAATARPDSAEPSKRLDDPNAPPRPGALVVGLDVGARPVFSPSFASDGSALFFDQETDKGGTALKEAQTGSGKALQVLSVLDDGARNYHPQLSPDGTTVAFDSDRDGVRGVYLSDRAGRHIRRVSGEGYAAVPKWSPDGRKLAFVKAEPGNARVWNVWTADVASGSLQRITSHRYGQPWGASWLPDGRRLCYSHEDQIIVLDTVSGTRRIYPAPKRGTLVRTPAVSPDGRRAIFQLYRQGAWLLNFEDGSMDKVLDDPTAEEFAWSPDGTRVAFHSRRDRQWGIYVMGR